MTQEPVNAPPADAPAPATPPGAATSRQKDSLQASERKPRGLVEWFGRSESLRRARASDPHWLRALELHRRAVAAARFGEWAEASACRRGRPAEDIACELYRQSVYWSLLALSLPDTLADRDRLLARAELALDSAPQHSAAGRPRPGELLQGAFTDFPRLIPAEAQASLTQLSALARSLIARFGSDHRQLDRLWWQRVTRPLALVLLIACVIAATALVLQRRRDASNLLRHSAWEASSRAPDLGCEPPHQRCANSPDFFLHTQTEEEPWVKFDLGSLRTFSELEVTNRYDCCLERAVPLVFEVSSDRKVWREAARREGSFRSWEQKFTPVKARWVRLRVTRSSSLHLAGVRVFP